MKYLIILLVIAISSCCDGKCAPYTQRVKCLESNTISLIYLSQDEYDHIRLGDTVWMNLDTHKMDDTCTTAMACVLIP